MPQPPDTTASSAPWWVRVLAGLYVLLGMVTLIPQAYYLLYYAQLVQASPQSDLLGQIWYWYGTQIDTGALSRDAGTATGAIEDTFLLGPLYIATGIGLWLRRRWVFPIGLFTAGGAIYAILYFILIYTLDHLTGVRGLIVFWLTTLPYLLLPIWLTVTLLTRRHLFAPSAP